MLTVTLYTRTDCHLCDQAKIDLEALQEKFFGLKGHRSVGGIRVSMYNALPLEGIEKLVDFMERFFARNH